MLLGAGRETKESVIDHAAGIRLMKKTGDRVQKGEVLARLYSNDAAKQAGAQQVFLEALQFDAMPPVNQPAVLGYVD